VADATKLDQVSPERTCIGCRGRADKAELLRLVWRGVVVADEAQVEPGRGAYLHPAQKCLDLAVRRRALSRALRVEGVDHAAVATAMGSRLAKTEV